jgi:hypothetical protein
MKNCLIVCSSNRLMEHETFCILMMLVANGIAYTEHYGTTDIALTRNMALTKALRIAEASKKDVIVMIDDDIYFSPKQLQELVSFVREHNKPAAGGYVLADGKIGAQLIEETGQWLTGLGFLGIPVSHLQEVAKRCRKFRPTIQSTDVFIEFCRSGPKDDGEGGLVWEYEDFSLTEMLGGVTLLPLAVGHVKKRVLGYTNEELADFINRGGK